MKVAVYTISKNEEGFVKRWAESCAEADYRIICDTGSSDNTVSVAESLGVTVHQKVFTPWRFDTSRNWSIDCIPEDADLCICLDMDEILIPGWRQAIEGAQGFNKVKYKYVWSWNADGSEGLTYAASKIHSRKGFYWKHPVHEVIMPLAGTVEKEIWIDGPQIHHHPDPTKSRAQYLPLLELAVQEDPKDDRNQYYLGREYYYNKRYVEATRHLKIYLDLASWKPERAAACRLLSETDPANSESWIWRALAEDSGRRENWVGLAKIFYDKKDWESCRWASIKALAITQKPLDYLCTAEAWGYLPFDFKALSCYYLGRFEEALEAGKIAFEMESSNERLKQNLAFYLKAMQKS